MATVTEPITGGPWDSYRLTVCETGTTNCREVACNITAGVDPTKCPVPDCSPFTEYTVVAVALKANGSGTIESLPSNAGTFKTLIA